MIPVKIFVNGVQAATGNIDLSVVGDTQTIYSAGGSVTATLWSNRDSEMESGFWRAYNFAFNAADQLARVRLTQRIYIQNDPSYDPEVEEIEDFQSASLLGVRDEDGVRYYSGDRYRIWYKPEIEVYFTGGGASYTISVSADPAAGGTVTGGGQYAFGATCTVGATRNQGYTFVGWYEGSSIASTSPTYSFTVSGNRNLVARFAEEPKYTIALTADPVDGGTVTGGGQYASGANCTVVATPNSPYTFVGWYEGTAIASTSPTYSFRVSGNRSLVARFAVLVYVHAQAISQLSSGEPVSAVVSINNDTDGDNDIERYVRAGESITVGTTAYGGAGSEHALLYFIGWANPDDQQTILSRNLEYTITDSAVLDEAYDIYAIYRDFYQLKTAIMPNAASGDIAVSSASHYADYYEIYTTITLTATPKPGYVFVKWTRYTTSGSYVFEEDLSTSPQIAVYVDVNDFPHSTYRAYFTQRPRTHLLVNSYNRSTPVRLVYDPATNKLVADF